MGILAVLLLTKGEVDQSLRLFLGTGVLGGFTTFSAFSLDAGQLLEKGEWMTLGFYVIGSVSMSVIALFTGMAAARSLG